MAKGDRISVTYSLGDKSETVFVEATQNGRKLDLDQNSKEVTVSELTRGGTVVRRVWFPTSAVLCIDKEVREE